MSLSELKRLVPSAFEKQGSAKLEKAEILQMTVDHLKMLHSKGKFLIILIRNNVNIKRHVVVHTNRQKYFFLLFCFFI